MPVEKKSSKPKPAATLVLVKPHGNEFKVYLLKRSPKSRFMPGVHVFPGGMVDPEDCDLGIWADHLDMSPGDMQQKLGAEGFDVEDTLSFVIAAIRETFEEAGVLLVNKTETMGPYFQSLLKQRDEDLLDSGWFKSFISATDRTLAVSKLYRWSHWITPRLMKLRFDTRFFLALMPEHQICRPDRKETTEGCWITPKEGLMGNLSGEMPLSPPAVVTLHDLLAYPYMDDLMKAVSKRSWGDMIKPQLIPMEQGAMIIEPWDPMYGSEHIPTEETTLENDVLDVEAPFSRLWNDGRLWRPVRVQL